LADTATINWLFQPSQVRKVFCREGAG